MAEGTQLNTNSTSGDVISDEDITGQPRLGGVTPSVPALTNLKLERTKIAVGPFGSDYGDATADNGQPVHDFWARELLERLVALLGGADTAREFSRAADGALRPSRPSVLEVLADLVTVLRTKQLNTAQRASGQVSYRALTASTTAAVALPANPFRQGALFYNDQTVASPGNAYLLFWDGVTTVTTSTCSVPLIPGAYFEVPFGFTGRIDVIWDASTGTLQVTEFT